MKDYTETATRIAAGEYVVACSEDPFDLGTPLATVIKGKRDTDRIDRLIAEGRGYEVRVE